MKFNYLLFIALTCCTLLPAQTEPAVALPINNQGMKKEEKPILTFEQQVDLEDRESLKRVLLTFARMLKSFFNIAQAKNPKDPNILGPNLTEMLAGVVNIALEWVRNISINDDETPEVVLTFTDDELNMIKEIKQQLIEYGLALQAENA